MVSVSIVLFVAINVNIFTVMRTCNLCLGSLASPVPGLDLEQHGHSAQHPFSCLLLGFEVEGPHIGGTTQLGLVDWTLIDVLGLLAIDWNGLDEDDGQLLHDVVHDVVHDAGDVCYNPAPIVNPLEAPIITF